jgi:hypothetical protein
MGDKRPAFDSLIELCCHKKKAPLAFFSTVLDSESHSHFEVIETLRVVVVVELGKMSFTAVENELRVVANSNN